MSTIICRNCGGTTNTAVCDWMNSKDDKADGRFAKWVDGKWVKGCCYHRMDLVHERPFVGQLPRH